MKTIMGLPGHGRGILLLALLLVSANGLAAAQKIVQPDDGNSGMTVLNAVENGDETTVFFFTWPYPGDPNSGKDCPLNFYSVSLRPGLPEAEAKRVAPAVCSGLLSTGGLLKGGDALVLAGDRLERWRDGERIDSRRFSSIEATEYLGVSTARMGGQFYAVSADGGLALAVPVGGSAGGHYPGATLVLSSLKPDGGLRWEKTFTDSMAMVSGFALWASPGGGALLRMDTVVEGSMVADSETGLQFVGGDGADRRIGLSRAAEPFDFSSIKGQEDMERFQEHQAVNRSESIESLKARPRPDGGFDVLFQRESTDDSRNGFFVMSLGAGGDVLSEIALGSVIADRGLDEWADFYLDDGQLVLLSRVMATQHGVQARRTKYMQNAVSRIPLDGGAPQTRLVPLDERYLEAAMNAGDAQIKDLPGLPGGEPALLAKLGGTPLAVATGTIGGRRTLRLSEAGDDLAAWNEAYEENAARLAKEAAREQRKADRAARKQQMNADLAASVGMTQEEFNALSKQEQKEVLVRKGDPAAMQAMMEKHATAARQGSTGQQAAAPADMNAQMAAAMAQAREQMANNPNVPPEMLAQMEAAMASMGQGAAGTPGMPPAATPPQAQPAPSSPSEPPPEDAVVLDANGRGFIEFENEDGRAMTLLIFNRQNGEELLKKDYPDGTIYEYIDFSRFGLPLDQIGVICRDVSNQILSEPALIMQ